MRKWAKEYNTIKQSLQIQYFMHLHSHFNGLFMTNNSYLDRNHFRKIEHSQNINNLRYGKVKKAHFQRLRKWAKEYNTIKQSLQIQYLMHLYSQFNGLFMTNNSYLDKIKPERTYCASSPSLTYRHSFVINIAKAI
nr:hypothetical protein BCU41_23325 [Vibrio lentus]